MRLRPTVTVLVPRLSAPARRSSLKRKQAWAGFLFAVPSLILFAAFAIYPMLRTLYLSFFEYNMLAPPRYLGQGNYTSLLNDPTFWQSIGATVFYIVATYVPTIILALGLALLLNQRMRGRGGLRTLYFTPVVLSMVVVAVIWREIYFYQGPLNGLLGLVGLGPIPWLTSSTWAPIALALMSIWKNTGYFMVLYLAGLQGIPPEFEEAARVDGANRWQQLRYITLPLLLPTTVFVVTMALLFGLQEFAAPYVLTGGGPAGATMLLSLFTYQTAFSFMEMGRAAAISMMFFAALVVLTLAQRRRLTFIQE